MTPQERASDLVTRLAAAIRGSDRLVEFAMRDEVLNVANALASGPSRKLPLTKRQREVLDFIEAYIAGHRYAPTMTEIAAHLGLRAVASAHKHVVNLEAKGHVRRTFHRERSIELIG